MDEKEKEAVKKYLINLANMLKVEHGKTRFWQFELRKAIGCAHDVFRIALKDDFNVYLNRLL